MAQMIDFGSIAEKLNRFKYPAIVLALGILLMLIPSGEKKTALTTDDNLKLAELLAASEGVGETKVLISETGVVVVCKGAGNAAVRLNIIRAVGSFTGFTSEKITILRMNQ